MYFNFSNERSPEMNEIIGGSEGSIYFLKDKPIIYKRRSKEKTQIGDIKIVNFFIGANNSGKSRFLRGLLKSSQKFIQISSQKGEFLENMKKELDDFCKNTKNLEKLTSTFYDRFLNYDYGLLTKNVHSHDLESFKDNLKKFSVLENFHAPIEFDYFRKSVLALFEEIFYIQKNESKHVIYIPVLRSGHKHENLGEGSFTESIKKNYLINEANIFTGLEIYGEIKLSKNNDSDNRKKIKRLESFLSKCFFEDQEVVITATHRTSKILFQVGEDEYPIHHVGDGIQALILLLLPVFTAQDNTWFFIEEPETHLHPGFQRIFLETILKDEYIQSKNLKFFFTTHSNHFLDLTIDNNDISIFQFQKIHSERFEIKNNVKPTKEILDKLGVQSSSVFLANTSIWVEGPTDRKYISKFLRLYTDNLKNVSPLKEDIDFAFFEYGGNLITHYLFDEEIEYSTEEVKEVISSFALSNKICLIADNDNAKGESKKAQREMVLQNLSEKSSNFLYINTVYKEIENLLPLKIISDFMETLTKKEATKIPFRREDYINIGLGTFYKDKFIENGIKREELKAFHSTSGTLKNDYKLKICDYFLQSDITYVELIKDNEELESIIKKLYDFIKNKKSFVNSE